MSSENPPPPNPGEAPFRQLSIADLKAKRETSEALLPDAELDDPANLPPPPPPAEYVPPRSAPVFPFAPGSRSGTANPIPPPAAPLPPPVQTRGAYMDAPIAATSGMDHDPDAQSPLSADYVPRDQNAVPWKGVQAGAVAGLIGACVWAIMIWILGIELGWMAAAVGAGVGYFANYHGGRGMICGILCAFIAVGSIVGGRVIGLQLAYTSIVKSEIRQSALFRGPTSEPAYAAWKGASELYYPEMPIDEVAELQRVSVAVGGAAFAEAEFLEPGDFEDQYGPRLIAFQEQQPDYEVWRDQEQASMLAEARKDEFANRIALIILGLTVWDFVFIVFGTVAAYYQGSRRDGEN